VHPKANCDYLTIHLGSQSPGVVVTFREISLPSVIRISILSSGSEVVVFRAGLPV